MKGGKLTRYEVRVAPDSPLGETELVAGSDAFATARQMALDEARRRGRQVMVYDREQEAVLEVTARIKGKATGDNR